MKTTTAIQHRTFPDGGFVLHKIPGTLFSGHFSAWFDAQGTLIDCEHVLAN